MSVECQLCTFFYAAWCCTWIFMGFQELIRLSQNCPFSPPAFVWWEIGCFLTSQGRSVTFSFGFTLSIAFSKPSHLRLSYYCFVIWFAFLWIIGSMVGWSYAWKYLSPSLWTTQAPSIWEIRPDPPPLWLKTTGSSCRLEWNEDNETRTNKTQKRTEKTWTVGKKIGLDLFKNIFPHRASMEVRSVSITVNKGKLW